MDNTVIYTNKSKIRFYQAAHYKRSYYVKAVHHELNKLPEDARISALSPFVPHLALRDHIYQFPIIRDAGYIVYSEKEGKYPMDDGTFNETIKKIKATGEWEEVFSKDDFVILKRKVQP
jgi:hypothetical protein